MTATRIGVCVRFKNPPSFYRPWDQVYREHLEYAAAADRLGFDGVWVPEHHCVPSGYNPAPFAALAALSQVTKRCVIGTQPLLLPLHNPVLAAEQAAVVDVMSGGRLILGVGAGYREGDFDVIGIDRRERGARSNEVLEILIKALREQKAFDFAGRFYQVKGVELFPKPMRETGPEIQLAVRSAPAAKRAAKHRVSVNLLGTAPARQYGPLVAEAAAAGGTDPATIGATVLRAGFLAADPQRAKDAVAPYYIVDAQEYEQWQDRDPDDQRIAAERKASAGQSAGIYTADALIEGIEADIAVISGVGLRPDWVNLTLWPPGMPLQQALDCLQRVAEDVLPRISGRP
jgi:alkanesulfonate monooxygenase SsuD/methylene tetrahydromethanopterin reductase-like flavin-dependent oxidoreductase (luciferase family)